MGEWHLPFVQLPDFTAWSFHWLRLQLVLRSHAFFPWNVYFDGTIVKPINVLMITPVWISRCITLPRPYHLFDINLVPRPDPPEKEGPGSHCLRMRVIIYAKTDEEGHMTFPIPVLDDVTYCTRTKPGLELYFPDSLPTLRSLQSMTNGIISVRNSVLS